MSTAPAVRPSAPLSVALGLALALVTALLPNAGVRAATGDPVLLNEVLVSHTGSPDDTEFLELYGTPGASLAGLSVIVVEGDSSGGAGAIDRRLDFAADAHLGGNGFYLVGNPAGLGTHYAVVPDRTIPSDWFENGSQTLALVQTSTVGAAGSMVTGTEAVLDSVALTDAGPTDQWFFGAPVVGPDDGFLPAGAGRVVDGVDTDGALDWVMADFQLGAANTPTPATAFNAAPTVDCGAPLSVESGTAATTSISATDPDGRVTAFDLVVTPDPGSVTLDAVIPAAVAGATATASLTVGAATPPGSYGLVLTARNDDPAPQQVACELALAVTAAPASAPEGIRSMIDRLVGSGAVAAGKAHLLTDRLARIERFQERGMTAAARAQLRAFTNQVRGLSPRWITAEAAEELTAAAQRTLDA